MRTIKADLHNHFTTKSRVLDVNRVVDTVRKKLGEGGICALVNYGDKRYEAFARRIGSRATSLGNSLYFEDQDVWMVKGEEVPTRDGDLLVLGLEEGKHLTPCKGLEYSLAEANDIGAITVITHPYFHSKTGVVLEEDPTLFRYIDAVEVHNGNTFQDLNELACDLWVRNRAMNNSGGLACSDGHSFGEVGSSYTEIPDLAMSSTVDEFNRALKDSVKGASYSYKKSFSLRGFVTHSAILGVMIIASKAGIQVSRGDKEALR